MWGIWPLMLPPPTDNLTNSIGPRVGTVYFSVEEWYLVTSSRVLVCAAGRLEIFQSCAILEVRTCFQLIKQLLAASF